MYKANGWEEIKKQNKFYIPNYEITFKEFFIPPQKSRQISKLINSIEIKLPFSVFHH